MRYLIKIRMRRGLWRWECECGRVGKRGYGYIGLAQQYGEAHRKAQHSS